MNSLKLFAVNLQEERNKFDIFAYGTAILKTMEKFKGKEWIPFIYLVKKRNFFEVPRILLSTLLLVRFMYLFYKIYSFKICNNFNVTNDVGQRWKYRN